MFAVYAFGLLLFNEFTRPNDFGQRHGIGFINLFMQGLGFDKILFAGVILDQFHQQTHGLIVFSLRDILVDHGFLVASFFVIHDASVE